MTHRTKYNLTHAIALIEVSLAGLLPEHRGTFRERLADLKAERARRVCITSRHREVARQEERHV
jgi:hypothetical protein